MLNIRHCRIIMAISRLSRPASNPYPWLLVLILCFPESCFLPFLAPEIVFCQSAAQGCRYGEMFYGVEDCSLSSQIWTCLCSNSVLFFRFIKETRDSRVPICWSPNASQQPGLGQLELRIQGRSPICMAGTQLLEPPPEQGSALVRMLELGVRAGNGSQALRYGTWAF